MATKVPNWWKWKLLCPCCITDTFWAELTV